MLKLQAEQGMRTSLTENILKETAFNLNFLLFFLQFKQK